MNNPDKMKFETPDLTAENIKKLSQLFPGVVAEGKVNVDLLRSYVGEEIFKDEAYEFTWVGKRAAIAEAGRPIRKTLRPVVEDETTPTGADSTGKPYCSSGSRDWDTTKNLYIEGDNLDVLKLLQESYLGKVKMVYIDPPYNTGSDFIYRDNFTADRENYEEEAGVYNEDGDRLLKNTETNGRFHSDWCSMIYSRLAIARNMLSPDGVIYVSIDENEVCNLMKICDEVFGANSIDVLIWRKNGKQGNTKKINRFKNTHEYILAIYKNKNATHIGKMKLLPNWKNEYSNPDNDPRGNYKAGNISLMEEKSNKNKPNYYSITTPTGVVYTREWFIPKEKFYELDNDKVKTPDGRMVGRIYYPNSGSGVPALKVFKNEEQEYYFDTIIDEMGTFTDAKNEIEQLFGDKDIFDTPKPAKILKELIRASTQLDDVILDFFSGSATTAHAVMQLNAEDGGNRKFIMVQLPEVCAEGTEAAKAGYKNICEIGKERIRRAGDKIEAENKDKPDIENLDIGFRVLKLDSTNMNDVYYAAGDYTQDMLSMMESNIKPDRTDMDLLFGCLLDWGLPLSMPHTHEKIDGFTVHTYNGGDLIACFDEHVSESVVREIASRKPLRAVFRDSGFTSSPEKINVFEIFKLLAPNTTVKVI